jgi:hypothetical protein
VRSYTYCLALPLTLLAATADLETGCWHGCQPVYKHFQHASSITWPAHALCACVPLFAGADVLHRAAAGAQPKGGHRDRGLSLSAQQLPAPAPRYYVAAGKHSGQCEELTAAARVREGRLICGMAVCSGCSFVDWRFAAAVLLIKQCATWLYHEQYSAVSASLAVPTGRPEGTWGGVTLLYSCCQRAVLTPLYGMHSFGSIAASAVEESS